MEFRTEYKAEQRPGHELAPGRPVLLLGSCFTEHIGELLRQSMWPAEVNPCGTLFNPCSVARALEMALGLTDLRLEHKGDCWWSWDFSTAFSAASAEDCLQKCRTGLRALREALQPGRTLIATFGTSYVFRLVGGGSPVANCHKQPSRLFRRELEPLEAMAGTWRRLCADLEERGMKVVLTVSPVRHVADGLAGNSRSKARLRELCAILEEEFPATVAYFPAYEIFCDDLRDYRFYADDLVHPARAGVEYVWEKFRQEFFDDYGRQLLDEGMALQRRLAHRPLHPDSPEAQAFAAETTRLLARYRTHCP